MIRPTTAARFVAAVLTAVAASFPPGGGRAGAAEENARPSPPPAATEDAINSAKRDFEAVKSARNPAMQPKSELPRLSMPPIEMTPSGGSYRATPSPLVPEKRSENWLLDAMEKPKGRERSADRSTSRRLDSLPADEPAPDEPTNGRGAEAGRGEDSTARKPAAPEDNPLTRYLGAWMTPQDFALLKPGLEPGVFDAGPGGTSAASPLLALTAPLNGAAMPGTAATTRGGMPPAPQDNPYLGILNAPPAATPLIPPPAPMAPVQIAPVPPVAAPSVSPPTPARSKTPDFGRSPQNEKYFKQLKRF